MVTRCVCCDISLAELLQQAHCHDLATVESLHTVACFGQGCGLCLPYVALALRTGRTAFEPAEALELEAPLTDENCDADGAEALLAVQRGGE